MAKILVSSKSLGDVLRNSQVNEMSVDVLSVNGRGEGTLDLRYDGLLRGSLSVMCYGPFRFKFKDIASAEYFMSVVLKIPEQPITLEDGNRLLMSHVSVFD